MSRVRRSQMCGAAWGSIMERALDRHGDAPTVDDVIAIALDLYPREWAGSARELLPVVAAAELRETVKQVAYLRASARERGLPIAASIADIRNTFSRYTDPAKHSSIGIPYVNARTRHPPLRAAAPV